VRRERVDDFAGGGARRHRLRVLERGQVRLPVRGQLAAHRQAPRLALLGEFRKAIHDGQIELYCQPKVEIRTNEVTGVEAEAITTEIFAFRRSGVQGGRVVGRFHATGVRPRIELASDRTYLKCREAVLKFLYERHRFVEAAE